MSQQRVGPGGPGASFASPSGGLSGAGGVPPAGSSGAMSAYATPVRHGGGPAAGGGGGGVVDENAVAAFLLSKKYHLAALELHQELLEVRQRAWAARRADETWG